MVRSTLALTVVIIALVSCNGSGNVAAFGDFNATFTGFDQHVGQTFYLRIKEATNGHLVGGVTPYVIPSPTFTLEVPDFTQQGTLYNIDFFADVDASGGTPDLSPVGNPPGVDHTWRVTQTANNLGLSVTFVHNTDWSDITPF